MDMHTVTDVTNPDVHGHGFVAAPLHRVVGVIDDTADLPAAVGGLEAAGFVADAIHVFVGEEGERRLDLEGTHHGLRGRVTRLLQKLGSESDVFIELEEALTAGHAVIGVLTDGSHEERSRAEAVLKAHGAHSLHYFGRLDVEDL